MINKTLVSIKTKALMKVVKETFETIGDKFSEKEAQAKIELENERLQMENELKENDQLIQQFTKEKEQLMNQVKEQQPAIDAQAKIVQVEEKKLNELLFAKEKLVDMANEVQERIDMLIKEQTRKNNETIRIFEEMKKIDKAHATPVKVTKTPFDITTLAENLKLQLHGLCCQYTDDEQLQEVIAHNAEVIQYKYEHMIAGNVVDTYYFKTSIDLDKENVFVYRKTADDFMPELVGSGKTHFTATDKMPQTQLENITTIAMKTLVQLETVLEAKQSK